MTAPPPVTLTAATAEGLLEVLNWTEEFLRIAPATTHADLRRYLADYHSNVDWTYLVDVLGFHTSHLRRLLETPPARTKDQP